MSLRLPFPVFIMPLMRPKLPVTRFCVLSKSKPYEVSKSSLIFCLHTETKMHL